MTTPKRILIIRTGGLGDFILSLPVIDSLATAWPDAELEILGRPAIAELARPRVARVTSIDDRRFARLFSRAPLDASDPARLYLCSFDLIVSFLGVFESDFGRMLRTLVARTLIVPPAPASGTKHAVVHFLESLRVAGIETAKTVPRVAVAAEDRETGQHLLDRILGPNGRKRLVMVHPGSGGRRKNWPPQLFAQTIQLFRKAGNEVILLQGEADKEAASEVLRYVEKDPIPVLKDTSLRQVAGALSCSQLVVGNDSGISHLAGAIGTPVVCLFGPTDPGVWRPLSGAVRVLMFDEATPERVYTEGVRLINSTATQV